MYSIVAEYVMMTLPMIVHKIVSISGAATIYVAVPIPQQSIIMSRPHLMMVPVSMMLVNSTPSG